MIPIINASDIPTVTTEEMIEVDRAMMEDFKIDLPRMMENAGRSLAALVRTRFLGGDAADRSILALAGSGGNGGGALVAARRLSNWGAKVRVLLAQPRDALTPVPAHQLAILTEMGVSIATLDNTSQTEAAFAAPDVILDGLIGYSLKGAPFGPAADLIDRTNACGAPTVSLDAPSGVDAGRGQVYEPSVSAAATLTLALPKEGLFDACAAEKVGELYCADISVPPGLYARFLSKHVPALFAQSEIIRVL